MPYKPGGGIYIHGSCVTVGCIPINDQQIEELYIFRSVGQEQRPGFYSVHIFPVRYNKPESVEYLTRIVKDNPVVQKFEDQLKRRFELFVKDKQLPVITISKRRVHDYVTHLSVIIFPRLNPIFYFVNHYWGCFVF